MSSSLAHFPLGLQKERVGRRLGKLSPVTHKRNNERDQQRVCGGGWSGCPSVACKDGTDASGILHHVLGGRELLEYRDGDPHVHLLCGGLHHLLLLLLVPGLRTQTAGGGGPSEEAGAAQHHKRTADLSCTQQLAPRDDNASQLAREALIKNAVHS